MLRDSTVVVVVVRTRPRAIPLAMIHMRKSIHGFPFVPLYGYGAPLGGLRPPSSAKKTAKSHLEAFLKTHGKNSNEKSTETVNAVLPRRSYVC